ncbi:MAG: hypothetical protein FD174_3705 [Geobacteraceae bacterium]|nr:MAG: hypothetical protein FD174_3705 [Geobacteraceae bacterium]
MSRPSGKAICVFILSVALLLVTYASLCDASPKPKKIPSLCKVRHPSDDDIEWECRRIKWRETPESLFGEQWRDVLRFNRMDRRHAYPGTFLKVPKNLDDIKDFTPMPAFYADAENEAKFILIDLSEQFLGAYEFGRLVFSSPVATGEKGNRTPSGDFRITAFDLKHHSSLYKIEKTRIPYPMNYALRFLISRKGISFWIHGRDLPGYPASHGCIGLYDEPMQKKYYKSPKDPVLEDARTLYEWAISPFPDDGRFHLLKNSPRVRIVEKAPM